MNTQSPSFDRDTNLCLRGLDDTDGPVVVVDDRPFGDDGGRVAVLIYDAGLRNMLVFDG